MDSESAKRSPDGQFPDGGDAAGTADSEALTAKRPSQSYWRLVRHQYFKNRPAVIGLWIIGLMVFVSLFANVIANNKPIMCNYQGTFYMPALHEYLVDIGISSWSPEMAEANWKELEYEWSVFPPIPYTAGDQDESNTFVAPFSAGDHSHYLGTDQLGRDMFAGLIYGARISLSIGLIAMGIATIIGLVLGALAGYYGGWVDFLISRVIEIFLNFPTFFLIIVIVAIAQDSYPGLLIFLIMLVIGITGWMGIARLARGEVLRVRSMEYVTAADALGFSASRVILRHVLPNSLAPVLVAIAFGIASAILTEAGLSFLGFGVPASVVTWGSMLSESRGAVYAWWMAVFPGLMIFLTVLSYNLIGDGLRDATDPRLKI